MRSAPVRSTLQATPGYLASNALPICSDNLRSTEVYHTTLPSFFAPSISAGVIGLAGGAADKTLVENAAPAVSALAPTSTSRREIFEPFIDVSSIRLVVSPREVVSRLARGSAPAANVPRLCCLAGCSRLRPSVCAAACHPWLQPYSPGCHRERPAAPPSPARHFRPAVAPRRL